MSKWKGKFEIEFKGEDVFYMDKKQLKEDLNEIYNADEIEITSVEQIGDIKKDDVYIRKTIREIV